MARQLPILRFPDPRLRRIAASVSDFGDALRELAADLGETMRAARGRGLAAPQVGVPLALFVVDPRELGGQTGDPPVVFANPELASRSAETAVDVEGCLSFPGAFVPVRRSAEVTLWADDEDGLRREVRAAGLLARVLQHELDHLRGVLLVDHLGPVGRKLLMARLRKTQGRG